MPAERHTDTLIQYFIVRTAEGRREGEEERAK